MVTEKRTLARILMEKHEARIKKLNARSEAERVELEKVKNNMLGRRLKP